MDTPTKDKILDVANKVIAEKGLNYFTLEEVAKEAGISKGGLLYYFPNKDSLIKGLIENYIAVFESKVSRREKDMSEKQPHNWLVSYINEQFNQWDFNATAMHGVLAAVALNKNLLQPVLEKRREWFNRASGSDDPILAVIIGFACDGMALSTLLGLEVFPENTRSEIMERLINLSKKCY